MAVLAADLVGGGQRVARGGGRSAQRAAAAGLRAGSQRRRRLRRRAGGDTRGRQQLGHLVGEVLRRRVAAEPVQMAHQEPQQPSDLGVTGPRHPRSSATSRAHDWSTERIAERTATVSSSSTIPTERLPLTRCRSPTGERTRARSDSS